MPFFSVVITTHNARKTISKTVRSVLNQTCNDFEIIVVDDCSNDNTVEIIQNSLNKQESDVNLVRLKENRGVANARNIGVQKSTGEYVAFLDDDDTWVENKLEIQRRYLLRDNVNWIFSNYFVMNEQYEIISKRSLPEGFYQFKKLIENGNPVGFLTVVIKREILIKHPFMSVHNEDYDLWLSLGEIGLKGYLCRDFLACYMKRENSTSSNKLKSLFWTYGTLRKYSKNWISTVQCLFGYCINTVKRSNK